MTLAELIIRQPGRDNFYMWLAYKLPRRLVYYAAVRLLAHASFINDTRTVHTLSPAECLKAWGKEITK